MVLGADTPDYLRTRSSEAIGDIDAFPDCALSVDKPSGPVADVVCDDARPVPSEVGTLK